MTENTDIIEKVGALPALIAAEAEGLSEARLRWRPAEDAWSIKEVCGHLCDDSEMWLRRLNMMIAQADPPLPAYDQEALVREHAYQDAEISVLLGDFKRHGLEIVALLSGLAADAWERPGQHPEFGRMTVREGMERMIQHTEGHLDQVRELRAKAAGA
jgi:hypothetical protein